MYAVLITKPAGALPVHLFEGLPETKEWLRGLLLSADLEVATDDRLRLDRDIRSLQMGVAGKIEVGRDVYQVVPVSKASWQVVDRAAMEENASLRRSLWGVLNEVGKEVTVSPHSFDCYDGGGCWVERTDELDFAGTLRARMGFTDADRQIETLKAEIARMEQDDTPCTNEQWLERQGKIDEKIAYLKELREQRAKDDL